MVGGNHLGSMETEGHAGSIPVISVKKRLTLFLCLFENKYS